MLQPEGNRALYKLRRLAYMPPREIVHRMQDRAYSELERIGLSGRSAADGVNDLASRGAVKRYLASVAHRFYFADPERLAAFVRDRIPGVVARAVLEADALCEHRVEVLGYGSLDLGREINWHRDPVTSKTWQRRFWADYNLESDNAAGDPKTIHELNRHQHLPRLAKACILTGRERYATEALHQIESWIDQNPPGWGINWQSSLEIGIRTISWLWTIFLLLPSKALDEDRAGKIVRSLFAQLDHVHRHTSRFSSPNTHLIGEAAALFTAGVMFHDHAPAAAWRQTGLALLADAADKQILDDGVYAELSSYYHCYALDFFLQALLLAARNKLEFSDRVRGRVAGMLAFLMQLMRPDGTIPLLGDDDGGRALALSKRDYQSFSEALCIGAVLFFRGDFKSQSRGLAEEALWLLGEEGCNILALLESEVPGETRRLYPHGGYLIQRSGWTRRDHHLVFDCGGLGMTTGGHSHADALSFTLSVNGRNVLIDPGAFLYNGAPPLRAHFRSTAAHNTASVDCLDQAEPGGTFRWKTRMRTRILQHVDSDAVELLEAEHDGYARLARGLLHRRSMLYVKHEYWIVMDAFQGQDAHSFQLHYHFSPGTSITPLGAVDSNSLRIEAQTDCARLLFALYANHPLTLELVSGQSRPLGGWASSTYGQKQPAPVLTAGIRAVPPAAALTFLAPGQTDFAGDYRVSRCRATEGALACACEHAGFRDLVVFSPGGSEVELENFRMRGELFWLRTRHEQVYKSLAVRASGLFHNGRNLMEPDGPAAICVGGEND